MNRSLNGILWVVAGVLLFAAPAGAIDVVLDYTYDTNSFFSAQARKDTLRAAADEFERYLDDLSAIVPGPSGFGFDNTWTATFTHPGTGGGGSVVDLVVPADTLIVYAGGRNLPGTTLGQGGPGGFSASGTSGWLDTVRERGEPNATGAGATDFGPWGGSISFDTVVTWSFDIAGPTGGQHDFFSVAAHELAHLFGIGTANSWDNYVSGSVFTGPASAGEHGGNVPLHTDDSHWEEGTSSTVAGASQEAAMDPTIVVGTRKLITDLDFGGLDDVGWDHPTLGGDTNNDGVVNILDLATLSGNWEQPGSWIDGDTNRDRVINILDLATLSGNWQATVGAPIVFDPASMAVGDDGAGPFTEVVLPRLADGPTPGLAGGAVPEPGSALLIALAAGTLFVRRRR